MPANKSQSGKKGSSGVRIVGLGASAGGLESLERVFAQLPDEPGLAFVVVQHLSPDFRSLMDEILGRQTQMPVRVAEEGVFVRANHVYLLPPRKEMTLEDGKLVLSDKPPEAGLAFPIDRFFSSLGEDARERAVAVVLSGTGSDGSRGIRTVKRHGGIVLVERPDTAKFDGMPIAAAATGMADRVLAATEIGQFLRMLGADDQGRYGSGDDHPVGIFQSILWLLHERTGIDFSLYKTTTVSRRVERRASLRGCDSLEKYLELVRGDPDELDTLYRDMLIGVTEFFRDAEVFDAIDQRIMPELVMSVAPGDELRIWVAGCATGEEAYTLAMLAVEAQERVQRPLSVKILATDLHQGSLAIASSGTYPAERLEKLSAVRREKYFDKVPGGFQVKKELRKLVVFASHDITRDAPFTRLHLVSCRNLMIYLEPPAQRTVLSLLHFGLLPDGVLLLGSSETPDALPNEFTVLDERLRLFRKRRDIRLSESLDVLRLRAGGAASATARPSVTTRGGSEALLLNVYDQLLDRFMPPSLLIESDFSLVDSYAGAERFLTVRRRRPSTNVLEMLPRELASAVSAAVHHALANEKESRITRVRVELEDGTQVVRLGVSPVRGLRDAVMHVLLTLHIEDDEAPAVVADAGPSSRRDLSAQHVETLEGELAYTQEMLQATVEELQTSNEELQSTNEELVASNEELQSTNEELHSINEELYTVNAEHQKKLAELREANSDMQHLLDGTDVGILFLDDRLRVRRFTSRIAPLFRITAKDIGRTLSDFAPNLRRPGLMKEIERVLREGGSVEEEVLSDTGESFFLKVLPYRPPAKPVPDMPEDTPERPGPIEGVVITVTEISSLVHARDDVARLIAIVESSMDSIIGKDLDGKITSWNRGAERLYGYSAAEAVGQSIKMLFPPGHEAEFDSFMRSLRQGQRIERVETMRQTKEGKQVEVEVTISPILTADGKIIGASSIARDVSQLKRARREAEARQARIRLLLDSTAEAIYGIDNDGICTFANPSCARLLGYSAPDELVGKQMHALIHHSHRDGSPYPLEQCRIYRAFQEGNDIHVDDEVLWRADGSAFEAEYWSHPIHDGESITGAVVTFLDVTARKRAEREMRAEAERRERFLAMLSHELRNPMAAVLNAVHVMKAAAADDAESTRRARDIIDRQCRHMARLLDDLLDVSRIARGKVELRAEPLDLRDAVRHAVESAMPQLQAAGVTLEHSIGKKPIPVVGDAARLQQVCVNLLSNAARYSPRGAHVALQASVEGDDAVITVEDEGEGIASELLPHIFDLFVQGRRELDRTKGGLGVGLTLARDLVQRHGGTLEAASEGPDRGSKFTVRVPLARGTRRRVTAKPAADQAQRRALRIVLVEDQDDSREALRRLLEIKGHSVTEAADGSRGAEAIETEQPDVAFVDIGLPKLDGYDVARRIRKSPALRGVYLVALSGYGTADDVARAHGAGFDRHLAKPAEPGLIDEILASLS